MKRSRSIAITAAVLAVLWMAAPLWAQEKIAENRSFGASQRIESGLGKKAGHRPPDGS